MFLIKPKIEKLRQIKKRGGFGLIILPECH